MTFRIRRVAPLQAGKMMAVVYGILGLIIAPFFLIAALFSHGGPSAFIAIVFPVLYAAGGFIGGVLGAAVYNLVGSWIGGVEITLDQMPPSV